MGSNLGAPKAFPPPTDDDIRAAWKAVALLDATGEVAGLGRSVARCIFALEEMRASVGLHRHDLQQWDFPKGNT